MKRYSLRQDGKRFGVEALCLLMVLYGAPVQALLQAGPVVVPEDSDEGLWETVAEEAEGAIATTTDAVVDSVRTVAGQPWTDALAIVLATASGDEAPPYLTDAVAGPNDPRFDAIPPLPPGFSESAKSTRRAGVPGQVPTSQELQAAKNHLEAIPTLAGWNLLSIPEEPADPDPAVVLAPIAGSFDRVFAYDACDPGDPWKLYDPADAAASDLLDLDPTKGFWLDGSAPASLPSAGTLAPTTSWQLCTGWNLIGYPAGEPRQVRNALQSIDGKYLRVFGFDPADVEDPWEIWDAAAPEWANDLSVLRPGYGYWVLVTEDVTLEIANEGDPPDVELHSLLDLTEVPVVTTFSDVVATVTSKLLDYWSLSYRELGSGQSFEEFARGAVPADRQTLAQFDPTGLQNGLYEIQLEAFDLQGRGAVTSTTVVVDGGLKIGHFVLPLLDMTVPVLGVPFDVARIYDSKDRSPNDFGHGWRLQTSEYQVRENTSPGLGWRGTVSDGLVPTYCIEPVKPHVVVVRFPDGSLARFQPRLEQPCQIAAPPQAATLRYVPVAGTRAGLEPLDIEGVDLLINGSFPGPVELFELDTSLPHNPHSYRLTTATASKIDIDEDGGLQRITDPNGNVVEVSADGLLHSRGIGLDFVRDGEGRITTITDPSGDVMTYEYDTRGDLVRVVDRAGQVWGYTYHDDHFLATLIDPNGVETAAFDYDGDNRWSGYCEGGECLQYHHEISLNRERVTDGQGAEVSYEYDDAGNVVSRTNPRGDTTLYEYNEFGDLTRLTQPDGGVLVLEYDDRRNLVKRVEPHPADEPAEHFTTTYTRGALDLVTKVEFPTGAVLEMAYDGNGNLLRQEDGDGNVLVEFTYGSGGVVTSETGRFGTTTFEDHNPQGAPRRVVDPYGEVTLYTYDADGNIETRSDPSFDATFVRDGLDRTTQVTYSNGVEVTNTYGLDNQPLVSESSTGERRERLLTSAGQVRGLALQDGSRVDYGYDDRGLVNEVDSPQGTTRWTRDPSGRVISRTDARGATSSFELDSMGRVVRQTDGLGRVSEQTYDVAGRVRSATNRRGNTWTVDYTPTQTTVTDPLGREEITEFDPFGLPLRVQRTNGVSETVEYLHSDPLANPDLTPTRITDLGGRTVEFGYNGFGNPTSYSNHAGEAYTMEWADARGQMTSITGPEGNVRRFAFDDLGRLETVTYGDGGVLRFTTNLAGRPETKTLPSGTRFDFRYDTGLRPAGWTTTAGESTTLVWDSEGRLTSDSDALGTTTYTYDGPDLESFTHSDGSKVTYGRDVLGRLTSVEVEAAGLSQLTTYGYDEVGNLVSVVDPTGGETTMVYDIVDRLTSRTLPNGVTTEFTYDDLDQVIEMVHRDGSGNVLRSVAYERQGIGEPTRITREDGSYVVLAYDDALRLESETFHAADDSVIESLAYTYDLAGNRTTRSSAAGTENLAYDPGNRLASVTTAGDTVPYTHDPDGRIVGTGSGAAARSFVYDSLDRLLEVRDSGAAVATFGYDAMGRRIQTSDAAGTRRAVVAAVGDGTRPQTHLLVGSDDSLLAGFAFVHERPLMRTGPEGTAYYLTDAKGSVIGLVDENGNDLADFHYDGFGNLRSSTGVAADPLASLGGDYRFHGEWLDSASDLYFLRARVYDPALGRFLSRDAVQVTAFEPESLNGYVFANSNPHVYSDPTGLYSITEVNVTQAIQNIAASIDIQLKRYALDEAKGAAAEAAVEFLIYVLESQLGPLGSLIEKTLSFIPLPGDQGTAFEAQVSDILCKTLLRDNAFSAITDYLYLEVPIDKPDGRALGNGFGKCTPKGAKFKKKPKSNKTPTNPDFLIAFSDPYELDDDGDQVRKRSTVILGDFKRSASAVVEGDKQLETIVAHAKNYGFWTVVYITLYGTGNKKKDEDIKPDHSMVNVWVVTLFGGRSKRK